LEVTVRGELSDISGASDEGMVYDFGDLKALLHAQIGARLDHVCMYYEHDELLLNFFEGNAKELVAIKVPFIPTAENIVHWCYQQLVGHLPAPLEISRCKLYETPNSWVEFRGLN
jgi:6-pyruvoyltetrahydropterin/6-carboxytetrahydropterin synthase